MNRFMVKVINQLEWQCRQAWVILYIYIYIKIIIFILIDESIDPIRSINR
jgi:hypothetical protein